MTILSDFKRLGEERKNLRFLSSRVFKFFFLAEKPHFKGPRHEIRYADTHDLLIMEGSTFLASDRAKADRDRWIVADVDHPFPMVQGILAARGARALDVLSK